MNGLRERMCEKGMTLVELLVALAIMSIMVTIGLGVARSAQSALLNAERRQTTLDLIAMRQFVKSQIESAAPVVESIEDGLPIIDFHGAPNSLDFISAEPLQAERPLLQRTRIFLDDGDIAFERFPVTDPNAVERRVLISGVESLRFTYFGPQDGRTSARSADWSGRATLPALVRIEADTSAEGAEWRPLSARPNLSARW